MAGFWNLSNSQLHDLNGKPYPGAKAYFYAADSLTKITVYRDYGLGTAHPNPVEADGNGYFPAVFLNETDEFFRQRITTRAGVTIQGTDLPVIPIIGPSGGGGGSEVPVDPTALFQTGDLIWLDASGSRSGWVRDNGRTIGSATSGASERANSDCEALFLFGWAAGWSVVGGAGATAAADWAANKPITLPDKRLKLPAGVADMGNTALTLSNVVPFSSGDSTTVGSVGGESVGAISGAQLPVTNLTFTGTTETLTVTDIGGGGFLVSSGFQTGIAGTGALLGVVGSPRVTITPKGSISSFGSGAFINKMPPFVLGTFYRKL